MALCDVATWEGDVLMLAVSDSSQNVCWEPDG